MVKPVAEPLLNALAQALNWMSQLLCMAADLLTKVLPLTSNGLVESPESVTGGAAIPPRADEPETEAAVLAASLAEPVPVAVSAGESTKTVLVLSVQMDELAWALSTTAAAAVVAAA
jgi:hypothetical protein